MFIGHISFTGTQSAPSLTKPLLTSSEMFEAALQFFTGDKYHKCERARALFKQAEFFSSIGNSAGAAKARQEAERILLEIRPEFAENKTGPLTLGGFDEVVMIMSR